MKCKRNQNLWKNRNNFNLKNYHYCKHLSIEYWNWQKFPINNIKLLWVELLHFLAVVIFWRRLDIVIRHWSNTIKRLWCYISVNIQQGLLIFMYRLLQKVKINANILYNLKINIYLNEINYTSPRLDKINVDLD